MTLEVVVVSRETIKPSLPTPQHLKNYKFSLLDQYIPPILVSLIVFYPSEGDDNKFDNPKAFDRLKMSLSEILTAYYPLAGRLIDNNQVECDDSGVEYVETRVSAKLNQVISCPNEDDLSELTPCNSMDPQMILGIQVNKFMCGGIAITASGSHKICDGLSFGLFLDTWAKTATGSSEKFVLPTYNASTIFPPREIVFLELPKEMIVKQVISKRFIFTAPKISSLKTKAANSSYVENPTKVEAIVALIWKCALNVSKRRIGHLKPSLVNLVVNFRGMMTPPLPNHSFGNFVMGAITSLTSDEIDLHCLVAKLREAKRKLDEDYFKKIPVNDVLEFGHETMKDAHIQYAKGEVEFYTFSSLCKVPFYEIDFGWGKPIWVNGLNIPFPNMVTLMNTRSGDGVEAWVCLDEEEMLSFECDKELLAYAFPITGLYSKL